MTGKIFRSCFLVGLAMMVLCTALFLVVMTNKHEQTVYAEMRQEMCYVRHGLEQSGKDYLTSFVGGFEVYQRIAALGSMRMSVCYSSILEGKPDNIDAMKPVLYDIIRRALSPEK